MAFLLLILICQCKNESEADYLFKHVSSQKSGIDFKNTLRETPEFNVLNYGYFYNGGGVAIGDINNDGLDDIYMTANLKSSHLYLNQGNLQFKNIAKSAGVEAAGLWNTGATMVDINNDGWMDIYVCRSAAKLEFRRQNLLFINNRDLTFTEMSEVFGLNETGYSTQAAFLDYDRDGDLDMYLLNHSVQEYAGFGRNLSHFRNQSSRDYGDKLFRNDTWIEQGVTIGRFTDVTQTSGIKSTILGFGLGVAVSDFNNDRWPDIYVSNDYNLEDYLYLNQQDGTFKESISDKTTVTSLFSMGCDVADINNDGHMDIFSLDMLPASHERIMSTSGADNYKKKQALYEVGFHKQSMRNMLQLNNGNGTFREIGQLAGVSNTDWSWSALFGDIDLDGYEDLFVTNGYKSDYTNMDFMSFAMDQKLESDKTGEAVSIEKLIEKIPAIETPNYLFRNTGNLVFEDMSDTWGLKEVLLSNGASMADLDNDGDLDIITNNVNEVATLYENQLNHDGLHFLKVSLRGMEKNKFGIGSRVTITMGNSQQTKQLTTTRGFQSSVPPYILFGLGDEDMIDTLLVEWPNGNTQLLENIPSDQHLEIDYVGTQYASNQSIKSRTQLIDITDDSGAVEYPLNFDNEPLLFSMYPSAEPITVLGHLSNDQKLDTVKGNKLIPGKYPYAEGNLNLSNNSEIESTHHIESTLITGLSLADLDQDAKTDIIYAAEWQPIQVLTNDSDGWKARSISNDKGLWSALAVGDINNDGRADIVVGNIGLNNQWANSDIDSLCIYVADFDANGDEEAILCKFKNGTGYPYNYRDDLLSQLPTLKKKFTSYHDYATASFDEIFNEQELARAKQYSVNTLASLIFINKGRGKFEKDLLPVQAQMGPVTELLLVDINEDGWLDIIYGGGLSNMSEQLGPMLSTGVGILTSDGKGEFNYEPTYNLELGKVMGEVIEMDWNEKSRTLTVRESIGKKYEFKIGIAE